MLSFFLEAVRREPLRIPQGVPKVGSEIFRVDVKAEGSAVVIQANGWVFVKGELFKVIASLELLATIIMVFGPDARGMEAAEGLCSPHSRITRQTLRFRTNACPPFPLSLVLMELALHLQKARANLDLQWIPREQNTEADALSNEEFEGFDESKRIPVKLEEPDFITLRKLMDMAEEIDSDFFLKEIFKGESDPPGCHKEHEADTTLVILLWGQASPGYVSNSMKIGWVGRSSWKECLKPRV